jgi:predicted nucleic acid-binding protein
MATNRPPSRIICDAGPIIHLDELDCLNLLNDFEEIILPSSVEAEVMAHRSSALKSSSLVVKRQEVLKIGEKLQTLCQIFSLDAGETESLAIMELYPTAIFLTDDAAARLVAEQLKFKVHGTIGVLLRSIRRGQKKPEEVLQILADIPRTSSLFIKSTLLSEIQQKIRDEFQQ